MKELCTDMPCKFSYECLLQMQKQSMHFENNSEKVSIKKNERASFFEAH